jgi:hypothetical protein
MQSMDPFGEIVSWHQQKAVYSRIGNDPNAWFEKELEKRLADPQFASAQLQKSVRRSCPWCPESKPNQAASVDRQSALISFRVR